MMKCSKWMLVQGQDEINLLQNNRVEYIDFLALGHHGTEMDLIEGISIGDEPQWIIRNLPSFGGAVTLHIDINCSFHINEELVTKLRQQRAVEVELITAIQAATEQNERLQIMKAKHEEIIRITDDQLEMANAEKEIIRVASDKQEMRLELQIKELQLLNAEKEETIRLAANQLEKQLDTLELLYEERQGLEAKHTSLHLEMQTKMDELQARLLENNKLPRNNQLLLLRQKDQEIEQFRREIAIYKGSLSWRITTPIRWMGDTARSSKRRGKMLAKRLLRWYAIQHNKLTCSSGLAGRLSWNTNGDLLVWRKADAVVVFSETGIGSRELEGIEEIFMEGSR